MIIWEMAVSNTELGTRYEGLKQLIEHRQVYTLTLGF